VSILQFNPFPKLETKSLTLRGLNQSDAEGIFALRSDLDVILYTGIKQYKTIIEAIDYIGRIDKDLECGQSIMWSITMASSNTFIGSICLWNITEDRGCAEIGYDLLPPFQGKGFMQEAVKSVIDYGFIRMKLERIVADLRTDNIKSVKILEGNGFQRNRDHELTRENGDIVEMAVYILKKDDYENKRQNLIELN
jgi:ribosomal-protein-alanine N-acetyltransferase